MILAILGSAALNQHQYTREPSDWDILCSYEDAQSYVKQITKRGEKIYANYPSDAGAKIIVKTDVRIYELEICWPDSCAERLLEIVMNESMPEMFEGMLVPNLDVLLMIKESHKYKKDSIFFKKTLDDILLMRDLGAEIPEQYTEWLKERERLTYTNSLPKLNVNKKNFFGGDGIVYEWCHDSLHEAIAFGDRPAYLEYAGGEVWSDMKKFVTLPERIKLLGVLEEACTLAAERSQLSFNPPPTERWSFEMALSKVCTSITSGVFRSFAHDNYYKVMDMYNEFGHTYMDKVRAGIASGVVKKLNKE